MSLLGTFDFVHHQIRFIRSSTARLQLEAFWQSPDQGRRNGTYYWSESSNSASLSSQNDTKDDRMIAVGLSEEYAKLDGAVGTRLSNFAPVPHMPGINTFIPNISDARMDHQPHLDRIRIYGLCEVKVSGDANCQFRGSFRSDPSHLNITRDTCFVEITPQNEAPKCQLWLSFWSEIHYNSLYAFHGAPVRHEPKKKHWLF